MAECPRQDVQMLFLNSKRVLDDVAVNFRKSFGIELFFSAISKEIRCEECHLLRNKKKIWDAILAFTPS